MNKIKYLLIVLFMSLSLGGYAQKQEIASEDYANQRVEMADTMRSEGKIYVLVAIIAALFAGFVLYTVRIEKKVKKLEKSLNNKQ